jgi:hypothetical protein
MNQQKEDLEKSIADLQRTIIKLNRICRLRFRKASRKSTKNSSQYSPAVQGARLSWF